MHFIDLVRHQVLTNRRHPAADPHILKGLVLSLVIVATSEYILVVAHESGPISCG
jgi:hypothetical protein